MTIVSNHEDARALAEFHGVPFHYVPVKTAEKAEGERKQLELLKQNHIDLVVLARYMQSLSADFVAPYAMLQIPALVAPISFTPAHKPPDSGLRKQNGRIRLSRSIRMRDAERTGTDAGRRFRRLGLENPSRRRSSPRAGVRGECRGR